MQLAITLLQRIDQLRDQRLLRRCLLGGLFGRLAAMDQLLAQLRQFLPLNQRFLPLLLQLLRLLAQRRLVAVLQPGPFGFPLLTGGEQLVIEQGQPGAHCRPASSSSAAKSAAWACCNTCCFC